MGQRCYMRLSTLLVVALALTILPGCRKCTSGDVTAQVTGPATIHVDEVVQLIVTNTYSDTPSSPVQPSFRSIRWESSNPNILTVSLDGAARGIAPGMATVTATPLVNCAGPIDRIPGTLTITVVP